MNTKTVVMQTQKIENNIAPIHKLDIKLKVNTKYTSITKITCKDFNWYIIDK